MTAASFGNQWALVLAVFVALFAALLLGVRSVACSARVRLRRAGRQLERQRGRLRKAEEAVLRARRRAEMLLQRRDRTKPRLLQEGQEALEDAQALARIAHDQVLIAEARVRSVIMDEFAPARQERLRAKYLPDSAADPDAPSF